MKSIFLDVQRVLGMSHNIDLVHCVANEQAVQTKFAPYVAKLIFMVKFKHEVLDVTATQ